MDLEVDFARGQFPDQCWEWAFFENAGGSYVPEAVIDRMTDFLTETYVQPNQAFEPSIRATERIAAGHRFVARLINADEDEIVMGQSTRSHLYVLARALRSLFRPGDEIIVTNLDHEGNVGWWRRYAEDGVVIKEWGVEPETASLRIEDLEDLLTERTRLVAVNHCSNVTGGISDIARIARMAHAVGAMVCVDGVAFAAHRAIDVKALDVDFYALSLYKFYGPHAAVLYAKRERIQEVENQSFFFRDDVPSRINPGGPNYEQTAAFVGVGDYFDALYHRHFPTPENDPHARARAVFGLFADQEERLATRFLDFLNAKTGVRLVGPNTVDARLRAPTFSFLVDGRRSAELQPLLARDKIAIKNGNYGNYRSMEALGIDVEDGTVRVSMLHYNTLAEVDRLIEALDRAI